MRFLCAKLTYLYENDVVRNVGVKIGECLRENWESSALRRSAKTGGGTRFAGVRPPPYLAIRPCRRVVNGTLSVDWSGYKDRVLRHQQDFHHITALVCEYRQCAADQKLGNAAQ